MKAAKRAFAYVIAIAILLTVVIPQALPAQSRAEAMTLADGHTVSGDFKGNGRSQIASLYDPQDDLGLRIVVLERSGTTDVLTHSQWYISGPNSFDTGRMKVVATDANFDKKTDIVVMYDDGATSVRLLVFLSTGSTFAYAGAWWQSDGYAFSRTKAVLTGNFSAVGNYGLLFVYQYDNFQMRIHYLESDGTRFIYNGNQGVYDSGPGQYDTARAKFAIGRFTRTSGPDQIASIYQYPNFRIRTHVFDPTPNGLVPVNGWAGVYDSGEGMFDLGRMKIAATDVDADGKSDIAALYGYPDGSSRSFVFTGATDLKLSTAQGTFSAADYGWGRAQVLGGDWDGDRKGDLAALESRDDGTTHVAVLRSGGATFTATRDAWVTPAGEVQRIMCADECWPLTGIPHRGGPVGRRGLVVKIDNSPSARPHYGISEADIIFETLVEGLITRLAAIVHSQNPGTLGSIRSGRLSDRYITPMVRGGLVYSGATIEESDIFARDAKVGGYFDLNATLWGGYYRAGSRPSPFNMFTSADAQRRNLNDAGGGAPVTIPRWDFLRNPIHAATVGGFGTSVPAAQLTIPYRANALVRYDYDPVSRSYARYQANGAGSMVREVDAANGVAIAAKNVVIIHTDVWETDIIQDIFNSRGYDMRLEGSGLASIFRDGRRVDGVWARATIYDAFAFYTKVGEKVYLSPGQTWVHVIPSSWSVPSN
ncbi:MAG TPA: DUF3048 domain-containing protein [Frankiaceae bacterium]|nr:DUF3048 domain-containing protein [Frankiaceae bacterium]